MTQHAFETACKIINCAANDHARPYHCHAWEFTLFRHLLALCERCSDDNARFEFSGRGTTELGLGASEKPWKVTMPFPVARRQPH